jgi:hypothetical protein
MAHTDTSMRYDSSAGELSSPPSGSLSEPGSPSRQPPGRTRAREEIVVGNEAHQQTGQFQQFQPSSTGTGTGASATAAPRKRFGFYEGQWVQLTAAGLPRKKPGRKPGSAVKSNPGDSTAATNSASASPSTAGAQLNGMPSDPVTKTRKPRKPRDPNAPPNPRKRKLAPAADADESTNPSPRPLVLAMSPPSNHIGSGASTPAGPASSSSAHHYSTQNAMDQRYTPTVTKRESYPSSMQSILNSDAPPPSRSPLPASASVATTPAAPARSSGQRYDPIRGNYDPVRETMVSQKPLSSTSGSPPVTKSIPQRSPSIASLIDPPQASPSMVSPGRSFQGPASSGATHSKPSHHEPSSIPQSPSYPTKPKVAPNPEPIPKSTTVESKRSESKKTESKRSESKKEALAAPAPQQRIVIQDSNFTTISSGPVRKVSPKQKPVNGVSTPKTDNLDEPAHEGDERSILDFGKARPGEETVTPTIILSIPIQSGETNKYVNFMRMAEDRYGWDALHPRLAANRDRKLRIAAAAASLEKAESGRESGDEMSVDLSDNEASNPENGGTSGPDATAKPKKKRNFKEDQYDVDDDFVDDSEMLWEAQAAASRDGFFVYSGPLVPEVEKPTGYVNDNPFFTPL